MVRGPFNLGKPRCGAPTMKGTECKCIVSNGGKYCSTHRNQAELYSSWVFRIGYQNLAQTEDLRDDAEYVRENVPRFEQSATWYLYQALKDSVELRYKQMEDEYKRVIMASRIKRYFTRSISSPEYRLCRDRLTREFNEGITV